MQVIEAVDPSQAGQMPQRYGRYVLLEQIGRGGMAEVFRAVSRGTQGFQRILVVKRILPEMSSDPRFVQMFVDEAKISALISHPNVVQVYEFGKLGATHFLTMEYVHGRNLSSIMGKLAQLGRLPPADVIAECIRQAALGLHAAHSMVDADGNSLGVIHRDVTPANLIVGFNGSVKVLDFGIARAAEEVKETRTQSGAVKGKVAYLAPEQISRQPVDHRADLFALGIVLHECLTGQRLFKADNPLAAMKAIMEARIVPPSEINADVPKRLDQIVARALARKPQARYQDGKRMAMDLEAVLVEQRYFSQRLPNFLKELFADEVTSSKDRILPRELLALEAAAEKSGSGLQEISIDDVEEEAAESKTPAVVLTAEQIELTGVPLSSPARAARWVSQGKRPLIAGAVGLVLLGAVVLAVVSGGKEPPPAPAPRETPVAAPIAPPVDTSPVQISFDSAPQGASIVDQEGNALGLTPATVEVERGDEPVVFQLELAGHEPLVLRVIPDLDKPTFGKLVEIPTATRDRAPGATQQAPGTQSPRPSKPKKKKVQTLDPFAD